VEVSSVAKMQGHLVPGGQRSSGMPGGQWSSGICDCCDECCFCCYACWCPCFAYGTIAVNSRLACPLDSDSSFARGVLLRAPLSPRCALSTERPAFKLLLWQGNMSKGRTYNSGEQLLTTVIGNEPALPVSVLRDKILSKSLGEKEETRPPA